MPSTRRTAPTRSTPSASTARKRRPATRTTTTAHEQQAFDQGLMDLFPATRRRRRKRFLRAAFAYGKDKGLVMGYFDGNTVTALWNYAQHFAMSDNSFGTTFGPSTPGLLNLVAGNTYPATVTGSATSDVVGDRQRGRHRWSATPIRPATSAPRPARRSDRRPEHRRSSQRRRASPGAPSWAAST